MASDIRGPVWTCTIEVGEAVHDSNLLLVKINRKMPRDGGDILVSSCAYVLRLGGSHPFPNLVSLKGACEDMASHVAEQLGDALRHTGKL